MLTRIRNGQKRARLLSPCRRRSKKAIAKVLQDEGYVIGYALTARAAKELTIELNFDGVPVIEKFSVRAVRVCASTAQGRLPKVLGGLGCYRFDVRGRHE